MISKTKNAIKNSDTLQRIVAGFNENLDMTYKGKRIISKRSILTPLFEFRVVLRFAEIEEIEDKIKEQAEDKDLETNLLNHFDHAAQVILMPTPMSKCPGSKMDEGEIKRTRNKYGERLRKKHRGLRSSWWTKRRIKKGFKYALIFDGNTAHHLSREIFHDPNSILQKIDDDGVPYWRRMEESGFYFFPFTAGQSPETPLHKLHTTGHTNEPFHTWDTREQNYPSIRQEIDMINSGKKEERASIGLVSRGEEHEIIGLWDECEFHGQAHPKSVSKYQKSADAPQIGILADDNDKAQEYKKFDTPEEANAFIENTKAPVAWNQNTGELLKFRTISKRSYGISNSVDTTPFQTQSSEWLNYDQEDEQGE